MLVASYAKSQIEMVIMEGHIHRAPKLKKMPKVEKKLDKFLD